MKIVNNNNKGGDGVTSRKLSIIITDIVLFTSQIFIFISCILPKERGDFFSFYSFLF